MTNHWIDIKNADVILVMGANPAENHPVSFKWIQEAIDKRGAKLLCVDPRFTRTAASADVYAPIRSGSDIAFLGGMIKYIVDNNKQHTDYVAHYTNASFLVNKDFKMPGDLDGLFSGFNKKTGKYNRKAWAFQTDSNGVIKKDLTLKNPNSVFQLLKKHYSRYNTKLVSKITGTPVDKLNEIYEIYSASGQADKVGTELYAMGWTQHTVGTQNIRTMAMIQLLLGNIGRAGGGVNALRGESNVQGATDHAILFHILPGYLPVPSADCQDLSTYMEKKTPKSVEPGAPNWWGNRPKYIASYLKAVYGKNATPGNDLAYSLHPKLDPGVNYSWLTMMDKMFDGHFKGFFAWGQNPACCTSNAGKTRKALEQLDWMVTVNLFDNETSSFWRGPGVDPAKVDTEVFLLPAAVSYEKEGSITNSGRWAQWRYKAIEPLGESMADSDILNELFYAIKTRYDKEGGAFPEQFTNMAWDYGFKDATGKVRKVDTHLVAKEINGYFWKDGKPTGGLVPSFGKLKADGTTSSGNWLYAASYTDKGNMMARTGQSDPTGLGLFPQWSWCWPVNRRILYNRASVDINGKPWDDTRAVIYWNGSKWIGDVPDGGWKPMAQKGGKLPFIMKPHGVASIFGSGLKDGPFPEHYEPLECPIPSNLMSPQRVNPAAKMWFKDGKGKKEDAYASCDARYPLIGTTYRVTEHWQTGVMTRNTPWLLELQPQLFVELSKELAKLRNITNGEKVRVVSARGEVKAVAIVTSRFKPFDVADTIVHQIGLPWCYGWTTENAGDSANLLTPTVGDANTMIPETKAFMVNILKGA